MSPEARKAPKPFAQRYLLALRSWLEGGQEAALAEAFALGREALEQNLGLMDVTHAHQQALLALLPELSAEVRAGKAMTFLSECMGPFEMAQLGFRQTLEELREQRDALVKAESANQELSALIVHDLKNPLTGIVVNVEYVRGEKNLEPDAREALEDALLASGTMRRLLQDLLDVYRGGEAKLPVRPQRVELRPLWESVLRTVGIRAASRNIPIAFEAPEGLTFEADPDLLGRVLTNLVDNALKYAPRQSQVRCTAKLTVGRDEGGHESGREVELAVADSGAGIPERLRESIFERFVQTEDGALRPLSYGLGLRFCRLAVEAHEGRIWVEENPGGGSCFKIALPLKSRNAEGK